VAIAIILFVILTLMVLMVSTPHSAIKVETLREPSPTISVGQTFTAAYEIKGQTDGAYQVLFDYSPKYVSSSEVTFSGAVAFENINPPYYKWGDDVMISKGEKQILHLSLSPGGKALDLRGQTFSVRITFVSEKKKVYSEEYQIKVE
jgi:hypothetical protein